MSNKQQSVAYKKAVIWGILAIPVIFVAWFIAGVAIYFGTGGGIVGGHDNPTAARAPANFLITILAVLLNFWVVVSVYRWKSGKQKPSSSNKSTPRKVYITGVLIPVIVVLAYLGYGWFSENKSGRLNPYTDDCIKIGAKGAKGVGCVWE